MSRKRWVVFKIAVACVGVGFIVGGIVLMNTPPEPREPSREVIGAWGDVGPSLGPAFFGRPLILLGALVLLGLLVTVLLLSPKQQAGRGVDAPTAPLPEARAHFPPPDERNGK